MIKSNLGYQALFAIVLGVFAGLFFGSYCSILKPIGDVFIIALQILVIPYIPSLLMHGLGSLTPDLAKKLFRNGWPFLLLLWGLVLLVCYIVKVIIPTPLPNPAPDFSIEQAAVSTSPYDLLSGESPLSAVFYNLVPGIALFSLLFGLAIMHLKEKEPLLSLLERINSTIDRTIKWISIVAPIGIFAHIASVMGAVHFNDLEKLQLYVLIVIGTTLFLSMWVLPVLISCLTSIPLKEIYSEFRIVSFLPFATGIPTLALPYINNAMRRLSERKNLVLGTFRGTSQTIIPIGFGFAQIGNFIPLLFIFFMAFFFRHPFTDLQAILLPFLITLFSIGTPQFTFIALPFLLQVFDLPASGFSLYAEISAITLNFQVLLSTASMLTFMYLVILKYYGLLEVHWKKLIYHTTSTIGFLVLFSFIGKNYIQTTDNYHNLYYNLTMEGAIDDPPPVTIYQQPVPPPPTNIESVIGRILERKTLRVGYDPSSIPFCYLNQKHQLVGYDIAYAYQLAKDLGVKLDLLPIKYAELGNEINNGYIDIAMSAILMDEERIVQFQFTNPYSEQSNVLVVHNSHRTLFRTKSEVANNSNLKIAAIGGYQDIVLNYFPNQLVPIETLQEFMEGRAQALMWSELPAYIWCLAHPEYTTISFNHGLGKSYFAYPIAVRTEQFVHFLNEWMDLKQQQGFELQQRQYWFLGQEPTFPEQRWSIIRNVLHWVPQAPTKTALESLQNEAYDGK